jgi:MFS transporter, FHS family, L-fucose permease
VVIGDPASASARLQFCQSWNGVASFIGPLIAGQFFFTGANASNLTNVQFVYLAVSCAGVMVAILFLVTKLPEVSEETLAGSTLESFAATDADREAVAGPIWKQYNLFFAFLAQFCYVGAQVTIASFFLNYVTENSTISLPDGSNLLSYALITFTVGRFLSFGLATVLQADFMLMLYATIAIAFNAYVCAGYGTAAVGVLIALFFFEAPMYVSYKKKSTVFSCLT